MTTGALPTAKESAPARPALRYHGGKWRLAPWILGHFPQPSHFDVYVEPYGGSAAVLLRKPRNPIEVLNDLDEDVVNFFRVMRDRPQALIRAIEFTPFARREWEAAGEAVADPVERARRYYLRSYGSISGPTTQWHRGWRRQKVLARKANGTGEMTVAAAVFADISHLYTVAARLRGVFIEAREALALLREYDGPRVLFYVDPPYPPATRKAWKSTAYRHEMTETMHRELATVLNDCQGMVILSGYACALYDELFPPECWLTATRAARTNGRGQATEVLWLNTAAQAALATTRWPLLEGVER